MWVYSSLISSLPLLVLIGPPLIAKTSFKVQPSAMLQTETEAAWVNINVTHSPVHVILMWQMDIAVGNIFTFGGKYFTCEAEGKGSDLK